MTEKCFLAIRTYAIFKKKKQFGMHVLNVLQNSTSRLFDFQIAHLEMAILNSTTVLFSENY